MKGMSCPLCAKNIEKQILRSIGPATVKIDLGEGVVVVRPEAPPAATAAKIRGAVVAAGFTVEKVAPDP